MSVTIIERPPRHPISDRIASPLRRDARGEADEARLAALQSAYDAAAAPRRGNARHRQEVAARGRALRGETP